MAEPRSTATPERDAEINAKRAKMHPTRIDARGTTTQARALPAGRHQTSRAMPQVGPETSRAVPTVKPETSRAMPQVSPDYPAQCRQPSPKHCAQCRQLSLEASRPTSRTIAEPGARGSTDRRAETVKEPPSGASESAAGENLGCSKSQENRSGRSESASGDGSSYGSTTPTSRCGSPRTTTKASDLKKQR
jgi:hypothetical protein